MKRIIALAFAAVLLVACNDDAGTDTTTVDTDTTTTTTTTTTTNEAYSPGEGDVTYREKKVRVYRNGEWVESDNDVTLDNGVVVRHDGTVVRDGDERRLEDGEVVNRTGQFFDKAGNAIENAWDATKRGVKKAANEVEEEVKDATTKDRQ